MDRMAHASEMGVEVGSKKYTSVRIPADLVEQAKVVAAMKGQSLAEFMEEELRPIVDRLDTQLSAERAAARAARAAQEPAQAGKGRKAVKSAGGDK